MPDEIDVRVRLRDARAFQAELNRSSAAIGRMGERAHQAGVKSQGAGGRLGALRNRIGAMSTTAKVGALALGTMGAAAVTMGVHFAKDAVKGTVDLATSTRKLSVISGMDVKNSTEWVAMAKTRGVQARQLSMGFVSLSRNITAADQGGKKQIKTFNDLGVSMDSIKKGDTHAVLMQTADGLSKLKNPAERAAYAQQLFSRAGKDLLPVLAGGSAALQKQLDVFAGAGDKMQHGGIDKVLAYLAAQRKFKAATEELKISLGLALIPTLTRLSNVGTKVANIFAGPGSMEEKMKKAGVVIKPLATEMGKTFDRMAPQLISHVANAAPKLALAFVKAFIHANAWGQIAIGTYLLSRLGLLSPLLRGAATRGAGSFKSAFVPKMAESGAVAGRAAGTASAGASGLGSAGIVGKFRGVGGKLGKLFGAGIAFGAVLALPDIIKTLDTQIGPAIMSWSRKHIPGIKAAQDWGPVKSLRQTIDNALPKSLQLYQGGGGDPLQNIVKRLPKRASGGAIGRMNGPTGDRIPLMAEHGEFMFSRAATRVFGADNLSRWNREPHSALPRTKPTVQRSRSAGPVLNLDAIRGPTPIIKVYLDRRQIAEAVADEAQDRRARK